MRCRRRSVFSNPSCSVDLALGTVAVAANATAYTRVIVVSSASWGLAEACSMTGCIVGMCKSFTRGSKFCLYRDHSFPYVWEGMEISST
ncbi:hypothetical protein BDV32DRAFT_130372 [Aspergillus pseudonomiae]|nr:hypothetical protein BDV32DRAFT_130372 [Aspergillus pseudonomiae]